MVRDKYRETLRGLELAPALSGEQICALQGLYEASLADGGGAGFRRLLLNKGADALRVAYGSLLAAVLVLIHSHVTDMDPAIVCSDVAEDAALLKSQRDWSLESAILGKLLFTHTLEQLVKGKDSDKMLSSLVLEMFVAFSRSFGHD